MMENPVYVFKISGSYFSDQDTIDACWAFVDVPTATSIVHAINEIGDVKIRELTMRIFIDCNSIIPEIKEGFYGGMKSFGNRSGKRHGRVHLMRLFLRNIDEVTDLNDFDGDYISSCYDCPECGGSGYDIDDGGQCHTCCGGGSVTRGADGVVVPD